MKIYFFYLNRQPLQVSLINLTSMQNKKLETLDYILKRLNFIENFWTVEVSDKDDFKFNRVEKKFMKLLNQKNRNRRR